MMQMMGGRFRNVMPSDLFKPGALAHGSLPAAGKEYASDTFRQELKILMRRCTWYRSLNTSIAYHAVHVYSVG